MNFAIIEGTFSDIVGNIFNNCRQREKWLTEKNLEKVQH